MSKKSPSMLDAQLAAPSAPRMLYDRAAAAYQLCCSVRTLDYLVSSRQLRFSKLGNKTMFSHGELVKFSRASHLDIEGGVR